MTAEVAVMNRQGVAIAADSAVTIGSDGSYKTYYTQQKLFNLSRKHFVGIMVYEDSEFMNINWEIIINEFSKYLGDNALFTLEEYAKHFLDFLRDFKYVDTDQKNYLARMSYCFFDEIKKSYEEEVSENYKDQEITKSQQSKIIAGVLKKERGKLEKTDNYISFTDDGFVKENKEIIVKKMEETFPEINDKMKEEMIDLFFLDINKFEIGRWLYYYTGIVFAGYGSKEIFPSIVHFKLYGKMGKNILHNNFQISDINESSAHINPYSQYKVINSFIRGMDPDFRDMIDEKLDNLIEKVTGITGKKYTEEISHLINDLKDEVESFQEERYKTPVLDIVDSLPKSNLAEMAEALVNITALRQHVSTEQETVGGPTDVALITKTDGFVWIKKKQIFHSMQDNRD